MEQVSRLLNFPCRYHPMGCKVAAPLTKKAEHERNCQYLQLKCPFHGQCSFCGPLPMVVPHLKAEHQVTPVPVQPSGVLFYRAKQFFKRNLWNFIYEWDKNLFRFMVKHIHASTVGRNENCNLLVAHIQYIGPDSMASQYAYEISLFDADRKKVGPKFEGVVSSTLKPLESQVSKEEVFVATTYTARDYTDQFANLNFIIKMRSLKEGGSRSSSRSRRDRSTSRSSRPPRTSDESSSRRRAAAAAAAASTTTPAAASGQAAPDTAAPSTSAAGGDNTAPNPTPSTSALPSTSSDAPVPMDATVTSTTTTTTAPTDPDNPQPGPSTAPDTT